MKRKAQIAGTLFGAVLWVAAPVGPARAGTAAPGPVVISTASAAISVAAGDYELLSVVQDFPPGVATPTHRHGGHVVVTVLSGTLTLHDAKGERTVKTGESWSEAPGDVHSVRNAGAESVRVVASFLLPKGAEVTTPVK